MNYGQTDLAETAFRGRGNDHCNPSVGLHYKIINNFSFAINILNKR